MRAGTFSIIFILFSFWPCFAQIGGSATFQFLNLAQSARTTALGGSQIATKDSDINLGMQSPSLLNDTMHKSLSVNHNFHLADISYGFSAIGYHFEKVRISTMIGATYLNYGKFIRADEFGNAIGDFSGKEVAITIGASRKMNERINLGANIKWVRSRLDTYLSHGMGLDIGLTYENAEKATITTFVAKNVGLQFTSFNEEREAFPLDIQIGSSRRLKYLPLRLSIVLHDLQKWNLRSDRLKDNDPIFIDQGSSQSSPFSEALDNFFHHVIIGGEFLIGKNEIFRLRFGYNHQLKQELKVSSFRSLSGFSMGFGIKIKKISFDYGFGSYHLAGGVNHISLSTNLQQWKKV